jgi:hypothetical protein
MHARAACRYVVAALLVSKPDTEDPRDKWRSRSNAVKRIINSEEHQYSDPITDFAKAVFVDFDFDRAQTQLQACQDLIANDYFLAEVKDNFTEKARMAIFEVYCRIHQRINLDALAAQVRRAAALPDLQLCVRMRLSAACYPASVPPAASAQRVSVQLRAQRCAMACDSTRRHTTVGRGMRVGAHDTGASGARVQVGMDRGDTEVWIAQLIRSARLDARIDGSAGIIVMGMQSVDPLDIIIERTNNLSMRTFKIANTIVDAMQKPTAAAS